MTSVTSPQQTERRGTDEIPGPRGGQGVRLLVLGADPDAQELRDQAAAAGYELAQRYSPRVSHVAYGTGIDPDDSRYTKIRDAGLSLLPLQKCAEELGLGAEDAAATEDVTDAADVADVVDTDIADAESLEIPPLPDVDEAVDVEPAAEAETETEVETAEPVESEDEDEDWLADSAADFVPGFSTGAHDLPLGAAVIGADPWTGGAGESASPDRDRGQDLDQDDTEDTEDADVPAAVSVDSVAAANSRSAARHMLLSVVWALIPFATFGLLTPVTFGYAAYRLRSRALVLSALGYTAAVVASFVLSAARPHSASPSDTSGALLTLALAATWLGGTLHAVSIRTRVFAR